MPETITPFELGKIGEKRALKYLKKKKFRIIKQGFHLYKGEIDIIAYDGDTLVFVEVKTRRNYKYGRPEEAVTPYKQLQIRKIAQAFLTKNHIKDIKCRFDVLALLCDRNKKFKIEHFIDAF